MNKLHTSIYSTLFIFTMVIASQTKSEKYLFYSNENSDSTIHLNNIEDPSSIDFLTFLSNTNFKVANLLIRQFLFHPDTLIRKHAVALLDRLNDRESKIVRFFSLNDETDDLILENLIYEIKDSSKILDAIEYALLNGYREEMPYRRFYYQRFDENRKRIVYNFLNYNNDYFFDKYTHVKRSTTSSGHQSLIGNNIRTVKKYKIKPPYLTSYSSGKSKENDYPDSLYELNNLKNSWMRTFSRYATTPYFIDETLYMYDGNGYLISLNSLNGKITWKTPLVVPNYAIIRNSIDGIEVVFQVSKEKNFIIGIDKENGFLKYIKLRSIQSANLSVDTLNINEFEVYSNTSDKNRSIVCSINDSVIWNYPINCEIFKTIQISNDIIIVGNWDNNFYPVSRIELSTGKIKWSTQPGALRKLIKIETHKEYLLMYSDEANFVSLNIKDGSIETNLNFVNSQFSREISSLTIDTFNNRILIDPSNGGIYSFPFNEFMNNFKIKPNQIKIDYTFNDLYTKDVFVGKIDTNLVDSCNGFGCSNLFSFFANKFLFSKFIDEEYDGWYERWDTYSEKLIKQANKKGLEHLLLKEILEKGKPSKDSRMGKLPVNSFRVKFNGKEAWVVLYAWGYSGESLGHIIISVISLKSGEQIGFAKCG